MQTTVFNAPLRKTWPHAVHSNEDWQYFLNFQLNLSGKKHRLCNGKHRLRNIWYRPPKMIGWHAGNKNCKMQVFVSLVLFLKSVYALWGKTCACLLRKHAQQYNIPSNCRLRSLYLGTHCGWLVMDFASLECYSWNLVGLLCFNPKFWTRGFIDITKAPRGEPTNSCRLFLALTRIGPIFSETPADYNDNKATASKFLVTVTTNNCTEVLYTKTPSISTVSSEHWALSTINADELLANDGANTAKFLGGRRGYQKNGEMDWKFEIFLV